MVASSLRPYQFSLRALLLASTIAALCLSWYVTWRKRVPTQEAALESFRGYAHAVTRDDKGNVVGMSLMPTYGARDQDMENLRHFTHLLCLDLEGCGFSDTTLACLKDLDQLRVLTVRQEDQTSKLSDLGLSHLRGLTSLTFLMYLGAHISDQGFRHLENLHNLESLMIECREATDKGLESLAGLNHLRHLLLTNGSTITGEGLAALPAPWKLEILQMEFVTHAGMRTITRFSNLRELTIRGGLGDRGAAYLAQLPKLRVLHLEGTAITEASMPDLLTLRKLEELSVPFSIELTPELRRELSEALPNLQRFKSANGEISF